MQKNLDDLMPAITDTTWQQMMWCTDDRHPEEILHQGHIDHIIRKAIKAGLDPVRAIQMGTINCARHFGITDAGAIAPGRRADMIIFKDLSCPVVEKVFVMGSLVAEKGSLVSGSSHKLPHENIPDDIPKTMNFDIKSIDFSISMPDCNNNPVTKPLSPMIKVIKVVPDQVITDSVIMEPSHLDGKLISDITRDLIKVAVIERYSGNTGMSTGFVTGIGLSRGAIASTVAHDSHNIIVAGATDDDMMEAVKAIQKMGGGFAVVCQKEVIATLALPVAGLMSHNAMNEVNIDMKKITEAAQSLGSALKDPFMTLGFLALPVIPKLKITDKGLVDVTRFEIVDLLSLVNTV
ncbi:Adenine deaminase (fragment) [Desulfamplus magnetovallimortis]|uniref:adenine deaminase n=1 Tax=Desulfamplus magnetovallimortis TaxID=1246637 RepID=A0A1W1HGY7_9BACT